MSLNEKHTIAKRLENLNVDVIEVGFAASSPTDYRTINKVSFDISESISCSLARANNSDIKLASTTLKLSRKPRIHTFIASSGLHIRSKLRLNKTSVQEKAKLAVRFTRRFTDDTEFSPEDCSRTNVSYIEKLLVNIIDEGSDVINITDTVGYSLTESFGALVRVTRAITPNSDRAVLSVHCHNDLGLALANAVTGLKIGGAKQVECTVNGIGERAGNVALEELVMVIKLKTEYFHLRTLVNSRLLLSLSQLVSEVTTFSIHPTKPIVGSNVFRHSSGIHQDGILKNRRTYEIINSEDVGCQKSKIVLSRLSGFNGFRIKLQELAIHLGLTDVRQTFDKFKLSMTPRKTFRTTEIFNLLYTTVSSVIFSNRNSKINHPDYFCYVIN